MVNEKLGPPVVTASFFASAFEDKTRKFPAAVALALLCSLVALLLLNVIFPPKFVMGEKIDLGLISQNYYGRVIIPVGLILIVVSFMLYLVSKTYGEYTDVHVGPKSVKAKRFYRNMSFYFALLGGSFLLGGTVALAPIY
jgi:hypothetical protein